MNRADEPFDPYAILAALEAERIGYAVIGAFARVVHGSGETTSGIDIAPSLREDDLRRLARVIEALGGRGDPIVPERLAAEERTVARTGVGEVKVVPEPWGTRGYDGLRIRANREDLATASAHRSPPSQTASECSTPAPARSTTTGSNGSGACSNSSGSSLGHASRGSASSVSR